MTARISRSALCVLIGLAALAVPRLASSQADTSASVSGSERIGNWLDIRVRHAETEKIAEKLKKAVSQMGFEVFLTETTADDQGLETRVEAGYSATSCECADCRLLLTNALEGFVDGVEEVRISLRGAGGAAAAPRENNSKYQVGDMAPDFESALFPAGMIKLSDYRGKVVLVDFWATWCGPCIAELPNVIKVYEEYHPKGLEIIAVSLDNGRGPLEKFLKSRPEMDWPQVFDGKGWQSEIGKLYGVNAIPFAVLLDGTGKIRYKSLRGPALGRAVDELLKEAAAQTTSP